jgi:light-regulated signal transduction histidine kinase (bacteriophytochrome)
LNAELEQRVVRRTAELEVANHELEAFAYSVSHDLRAPLRAMDGFSRILMEDFAANLDSSAQRYLRLVRENAQQMGDLIDHLLAFSRLGRQALKIQPVDVADVVCQAVENVYAAREGRDVTIVIGDLPSCQADPVLLRQVYINLLGNALKFTRERENPTIEVGCLHQDGQDVFFVKDNGVGFDMQYAHKLFGVFQRLHRAEEYEGTGVGLATVQRIIHRHGGRIWAEAEANRGAAFFFTLGGTLS